MNDPGPAGRVWDGLGADDLVQALLRLSGEGFALSRTDGVLVQVSHSFVELTGHPQEELLGRTLVSLGLIPPGASPSDPARASRWDTELRTPSGELRQVEVASDVLNAGPEPYVLTVLRDVTEQHSAEGALRAAEADYRDLFENAATGIAHVRADGTLLEVNRAWARVLGYESPEQYVAEVRTARNIYEDPAQREELLRELSAHGAVHGFEGRLRHRDGSRVWVALDARAVTDESGQVVAVHASGLDITDRKRAEQALRESEARFRSIFAHGLDGILLTAADDTILAANPAACAMLGGSEDQLRRQGLSAVVDLDDERLAAALNPRPGRPAHTEIRMRRMDGTTFPAEITHSTFEDADGASKHSLIVRDVSERRRVEDELRRATAEADAANRAKSDFLSRMSHELRTPLNAILGFAQLLEMDMPARRDEVAYIIRAGRHLLALINEVLDISHIETGHLTLSPEPVPLHELTGETVGLISPLAAAREISVHTVCAPGGDCYAHADRQRTKQVLLNLLSNAIKYNHPGGTVTVTCDTADTAGGSWTSVEVRDTGIGIPAGDLERLFVPFERLGAAASDIEGTGVGLALSQRLARAMGGDIAVSSEVGRGSAFRLILPGASRPADVPEPDASVPSAAAPVTRHGLTLLCIEDNLANTRLVEQIIARRPGWELRTAGQGQLGLDLALAEPPGLVLLDLHLPDMNGIQVLRRLKAGAATAAVPVAIVSADATPNQVDRLRDAGADAYFTKPIDVRQLLDYLDQISLRAEARTEH